MLAENLSNRANSLFKADTRQSFEYITIAQNSYAKGLAWVNAYGNRFESGFASDQFCSFVDKFRG